MRARAVIQTAAGMPDLLNGSSRFARWARIDPKASVANFRSSDRSTLETVIRRTCRGIEVRRQQSLACANRRTRKHHGLNGGFRQSRSGAADPLLPLAYAPLTTAVQRLLPVAIGKRTHANRHQAVIGLCRMCWPERPLSEGVQS